jgi:hypothetical protein
VAEESGKKQEDLELSPEKAGAVKGGVIPADPGGTSTRKLAVKHRSHKKGVQGPIQKLPHH